jgi:phage-related protein
MGGGYRQISPDVLNNLDVDASFAVVCHEDQPGKTFTDLEALISLLDGTETYQIEFPGKTTKFWEVIDYAEQSVNHLVTNVTINIRSWNDSSVFDAIIPGTARLVYTPSWSSITTTAPTYATLQDGAPTGFGVFDVTPNKWLQADLGSVKPVTHVAIEAGAITGFGSSEAFVNTAQVQISDNGSTWVHVQTVAGLTDAGGKRFFGFAETAYCRYVRIFIPGARLGLSRFEVWGLA